MPPTGSVLVAVTVLAALAGMRALRRARSRRPEARTAGRPRREVPVSRHLTRHRHQAALDEALPSLLEEVASGRRAGTALALALSNVASSGAPADPARQRLRDSLAPVGRGQPLAEALASWRERAASADERLAAGTLALIASLGGAPPAALDTAAAAVRERRALAAEVRTQSAQARASATVLTLLPPAFLVLAGLHDPRVADVLVRTPAGWACLAAGTALDALGAWWMWRLIRRAAP
jgi:tight adherence protein B